MIISPHVAIQEGMVTFPEWMTEEQQKKCIQQNGIDVTMDRLFAIAPDVTAVLTEDERIYKPLQEQTPQDGLFLLRTGLVYDWSSDFKVNVPLDHCAMIIIRSSLNRVGCLSNSGNYDSGFVGNCAGVMSSRAGNVKIGLHSRVAQIMFYKCESASEYNGVYQNLDPTKNWSVQVPVVVMQ